MSWLIFSLVISKKKCWSRYFACWSWHHLMYCYGILQEALYIKHDTFNLDKLCLY